MWLIWANRWLSPMLSPSRGRSWPPCSTRWAHVPAAPSRLPCSAWAALWSTSVRPPRLRRRASHCRTRSRPWAATLTCWCCDIRYREPWRWVSASHLLVWRLSLQTMNTDVCLAPCSERITPLPQACDQCWRRCRGASHSGLAGRLHHSGGAGDCQRHDCKEGGTRWPRLDYIPFNHSSNRLMSSVSMNGWPNRLIYEGIV